MTNTVEPPVHSDRSAASRPIMITTAIIGGFALLATGTSAALAASGVRTSSSDSGSAQTTLPITEITGITGIEIDATAADFTIMFDDVPAAMLKATGARSNQWLLRRDDTELIVEGPRGFFGSCFGWCAPDEQTVVLTLPAELDNRTIDVDAVLGAGELRAEGRFRDLDLELSAGRMTIVGSARTVDLEMGAGTFIGDLRDVREASFSVSAGSAEAQLRGSAPREVDLEVSAGSLDLALPDVSYQVKTEASAGSVDNQLSTDPGAHNLIDVEVSAGKVTLRPGREI